MSTNEMMFSRRSFLNHGAQLLSAVGTLPLFLDRSAHCLAADFAANPQGAGRPDRILVIVQMAGGNDGLNTVVPIRNDDYYKARPTLAIKPAEALKLTDDFGLHPSMAGFKKLYDAGELAILQSVGYPNHNRSHFRSTDIWQTAEPEATGHSGWLGRYFDSCCNGQDPGKDPQKALDPAAAIALTSTPPTTLTGQKYIPLVFRSPDDLMHKDSLRDPRLKSAFEKLNDVGPVGGMDKMGEKKTIHIPRGTERSVEAPAASHEKADDFIQRSALNARVYADQIRKTASTVKNAVSYPETDFAGQLKLVAQMISSGLSTRVYYTQIGGFDTHATQSARHPRLLSELSDGIAAFMEDLRQLGHLDRTMLMTFSEFGRRVTQNGSAGTDHGEAGPLFVCGGAVKSGFLGMPPDLRPDQLHRGDVAFKLDFRQIYATVLDKWLRADSALVLGRKFEMLDLFRPERIG